MNHCVHESQSWAKIETLEKHNHINNNNNKRNQGDSFVPYNCKKNMVEVDLIQNKFLPMQKKTVGLIKGCLQTTEKKIQSTFNVKTGIIDGNSILKHKFPSMIITRIFMEAIEKCYPVCELKCVRRFYRPFNMMRSMHRHEKQHVIKYFDRRLNFQKMQLF